MATKREAVKAAQTVLTSEFPNLRVDGVWGVRTDGAFVKSAISTQKQVVTTIDAYGFTLNDVRFGGVPAGVWISEAEARSLAEKAAKLVGVEPGYLYFLLELEPVKRQGSGGREFNTQSVSPNRLYKGLFQIGADAWEDAQPVAASAGVALGSFEGNWQDPFKNAVAAAAFAVRNAGYARQKYGYNGKVTNDLLYAMHNQGHSFISSAKAGGIGRYASGQSSAAKQVLTRASAEVREA